MSVRVAGSLSASLKFNFFQVQFKITFIIGAWAHTANPLIIETNFFISALAVPLTSQDVNGLVIEAKFFSQSANLLQKNCFNRIVSITHQLKSTIFDRFQLAVNNFFMYSGSVT